MNTTPLAAAGVTEPTALPFRRGTPLAPFAQPAVVDGRAGAVVVVGGRLRSVVKFTVAEARVVALGLTLDPDTLARLSL